LEVNVTHEENSQFESFNQIRTELCMTYHRGIEQKPLKGCQSTLSPSGPRATYRQNSFTQNHVFSVFKLS